jgi:dTDP-4-dehydrorhamnose 3,5-epimerase
MRVLQTALDEVVLIEPTVLADERGYLFEAYNRDMLSSVVGAPPDFVLDLQSRSTGGVIRGIHYQLRRPQAKLISVVQGKVFDVVVDLRRSSPRFGHWTGAELSAENKRQIWIPAGFGHAFLTLSQSAEVLYKLTAYHSVDYSRTIAWNDPEIAIAWPTRFKSGHPILSQKDRDAALLCDAEVFP